MRIIQVTPRYYPTIGGIETIVQKISESLVKKGNEVTIYSIDKQNGLTNSIINGVTVKRFTPLFQDPLYFPEPKFAQKIRKEKADIIHAHNIHTFPPLIAALSKTNSSKLILQPHYHKYGQTPLRNSLFQLYQKTFFNLLFMKTNTIIANSLYEQQTLQEDFPKITNIHLIPEGLDTTEALKIKHNPLLPKRILFVGILKNYKNVHKLLEGFAYLIKKEKKDYRLVIIGEGPEYANLTNLSKILGIENSVEWKHNLPRPQLLEEYSKASIFVMLSQLESFSRVVYDALIIGLPTVLLNFGALHNLISEGFAEGVNSLKPKNIAQSLENASEKMYRRINLNNESFLNWETYIEKIIDLFK